MKTLTSENVSIIFMACLFKQNEPTLGYIEAKGIIQDVGFHPERIKQYENEIIEMLMQLPDDFMQSRGGGMSFLNACMDKNGNQWGEHQNMEQLFQLGIAINKAKFLMDRSMWVAFPGGVPYCVVFDKHL